MKPDIGIDKEDLAKVIEILHLVLADETILYQKTKQFHWNVTGPHFISYHELFDKHAEIISETIDEVAERIRALGDFVKATLSANLKSTHLKEQENPHIPALEMLKELLKDHEQIIRFLRESLSKISEHEDEGTVDFLTSTMEEHEKITFFLRSHLE